MASIRIIPGNSERSTTGPQHKEPPLIRWLILLFLLGSLVAAPVAAAPGWKFHADNQNTGVYDDGGVRPEGVLLWNSTTGGNITSSPAVVDGVVYVGSWDDNLYAFNAVTGAFLWKYYTNETPHPFVSSSPAVVNGVVYIGGARSKIQALDAATGILLWNYTTSERYFARSDVTSSPAVDHGVVYVGNYNSSVYAFNATTGALLWNSTIGEKLGVLSSPAVANGVVYIGCDDGNLYALDAETGDIIWNYTTGNRISSSPAIANGVVYVGSNDNNLYALNASAGALLWNYKTGKPVDSSPAIANGVVYVGSQDDNLYALDASTGTLLWNYTTGGMVRSSPAVANGVVYVGSNDNNLYALDATTGTLLWNYTTGGMVRSSPAVANGAVYAGSEDSNLYAIGSTPVVVGGGKGYYLVHSNVEGADVYFNGDRFEGTITNGTLLVTTCPTCTPVWSFTVKNCGYIALTQNNTRHPGNNETIDLYANLTAPKEPLIADFIGNVTTGTAPLTVGFSSHSVGLAETWNWSFGDGTWSEERDPVHTYGADGVYTVGLSETNSACQNSTMVKPNYITVGTRPPLSADFTVSPVSGTAPLTVKCSDKSVGNPTRFVYNFGDGLSMTGPNPVHTYRFPGVYDITLTIMKFDTRSGLISSTITRKNIVTVGNVPFTPPIANFTAGPVNGTAPLKVSFTDQSTGSPAFYNYDFGDGVNMTGVKNPSHTFRYPGTYTVTLTVMKNDARNGTLVSNTSVQKGLISAEPVHNTWTFVVFGDSPDNTINTSTGISPNLSRIASAIAGEKPDLAVYTGDLTSGWLLDDSSPVKGKYTEQYGNWMAAVSSIHDYQTGSGIPLYVMRGNHEDGPPGNVTPILTAYTNTVASGMPANGPAGEEKLTYSFTYRDAKFIINDEYMPHNGLEETVNQSWVDSQLTEDTRPFMFVFGHSPAYRVDNDIEELPTSLFVHPEQRDVFWQSLVDNHVSAYLCGHAHMYVRGEFEGIPQIVSGNAGAPMEAFNLSDVDPVLDLKYPLQNISQEDQKFGYLLITVNDATGTWSGVQKEYDPGTGTWITGDTFSLPARSPS